MWKRIRFPVLSFDIYICVSQFDAVNRQFKNLSKKDNIKSQVFKYGTLRVNSLLILPPWMRSKKWERERLMYSTFCVCFGLFYSKVNDLPQESQIKPQINILLPMTIDTVVREPQSHLVVRITMPSRMFWLLRDLTGKESKNLYF